MHEGGGRAVFVGQPQWQLAAGKAQRRASMRPISGGTVHMRHPAAAPLRLQFHAYLDP